MAEQLTLDELVRQRGAVDCNERALGIGAEAMQLARDQLLPRATLSHDQHRARHRGDPHDRFLELGQRGTRPHEWRLESETTPQQCHLLCQAPPLDRVLHLLRDALHRLGFVDEAVRAQANRLHAAVVVTGPGINDDRNAEAKALDRTQHLETVHPRHLEIEYHAVDGVARETLERGPTAFRDEGFVAAQALQVIRVLLGHSRDIVHDQDKGHCAGSSTTNRDPFPGSVSTFREPCESITSLRTMERPRPVPPSFVV